MGRSETPPSCVSDNFEAVVSGIVGGWGVATTVWSLGKAEVGTAGAAAVVTSDLGTEGVVVPGKIPIFCVGAAGAAGALVAVLVVALLSPLVLEAVVGA